VCVTLCVCVCVCVASGIQSGGVSSSVRFNRLFLHYILPSQNNFFYNAIINHSISFTLSSIPSNAGYFS
jgi:hypothetical protein